MIYSHGYFNNQQGHHQSYQQRYPNPYGRWQKHRCQSSGITGICPVYGGIISGPAQKHGIKSAAMVGIIVLALKMPLPPDNLVYLALVCGLSLFVMV
jgi:hypothetical protein